MVEGFKKNEEQLKSYIDEYKSKLSRQDQKYQLLKDHAEEKLEEANKEIDNISKSQVWSNFISISCIESNNCHLQEAEIAKLSAMLQKTEKPS